MAGTKAGGRKAKQTNLQRYGEDYYSKIGKMGGAAEYTGAKGFASNRELARAAGAVGGRKSTRKGKKNGYRKNLPEMSQES